MAMFRDMLGSGESLFLNPAALDFDYIPKLVPYREGEQKHIADCIRPLFQKRNARNLFIHGSAGVGKTVAVRHVLQELEEETDEIFPVYVNCWQRNTSFKVAMEICDSLGYKFTQNKRTEELFAVAKQIVNKKSAVFVFDEVDKAEDFDFLYTLLEEIYRKSILLITNYPEWLAELDSRIRSRLLPEAIEFRPYNLSEVRAILQQRADYAFPRGAVDTDAFEAVVQEGFQSGDLRRGIYLLREAGSLAEEASSRKLRLEHVRQAIGKSEFLVKKPADLEDAERFILDIAKKHSGKRIGEIFKAYQEAGGTAAYKTFQRKIARLSENRFLTASKIPGGAGGKTTIIRYADDKKLTDF